MTQPGLRPDPPPKPATQATTGPLAALARKFDDALRFLDLAARRTDGGWMDTHFGVKRHTIAALWLPAALCGLMALGSPTLARSAIAAAATLVAGWLVVQRLKACSGKPEPVVRDLVEQAVLVSAIAVVAWIACADSYGPVWPYKHALIAIAFATALALLVGALLLGRLFEWPLEQSRYGTYLPQTELFLSRNQVTPPTSLTTILTGLAAATIRAPLMLLTLPAIATLVAPPAWVLPVALTAGAVSLCALVLAGVNDRFATMWALFQQALFNGGALLVSLVVVVLAALRLADVSYVTTIFDSAAWWTIATVFASAYVLSWWFDYWSQRLLTDRLLRLLDPDARGVAKIEYPYACVRKPPASSVPSTGRVLQVHGAGRYIVYHPPYTDDGHPRFQAHTPQQLIELLATHGAPGGKAIPSPGQINARIASYQVVVGLVFVAIAGGGMWWLHRGIQLPEVALTQSESGVTLTSLLVPDTPPEPDAPMIVVAASGGGTRAAVYTAAVLEGIALQGKSKNVVLGSGVSGGGAALAYFAGHRASLVTQDRKAWQCYFDRMIEPFIQDVLLRATEWNMVSSGRLGMALRDSFRDRWKLERTRLADVEDMGLIFNTALAGHFERPGAPDGQPLYEVERKQRKATTSLLAGGRLVLTNLSFSDALTSPSLDPDAALARLPVVIRSDELRLEDAAALNANFPPVFSNAAIDVDQATRYWVTDGGAVDNRGIEMALYALRDALRSIKPDRLPRLHIVVADASAFSSEYSQDRGVSTMAGAGSRYASHLNAELMQSLRDMYGARARELLKVSYVMMPDMLRRSGSFGTHWMLQHSIDVEIDGKTVTLSGHEMVRVLRALHGGDETGLSDDAKRVLARSRQDRGHCEGWTAVTRALGGPSTTPACSAVPAK